MTTSPYRRGADDGFIFGIYLSVLLLSMFAAPKIAILGPLALVLIICVPLVIFLFMRRYDRQLSGCVTFPMFWMQGMVTFICGILLAGAVLVVYLTWIQPNLIYDQLTGLIETASLPQAKGTVIEEMGKMASEMIRQHIVPSPISIVVELILLAIVTGSLLSMTLGGLMVLRRRFARSQTPR